MNLFSRSSTKKLAISRTNLVLILFFFWSRCFGQEPVPIQPSGATPPKVIHLHEFVKDEGWIKTYLWVQDVNNPNGTFSQEKSRKGIIETTELLNNPGNTPVMNLLAQDMLSRGYLNLSANLSKKTDESALKKWMAVFVENWEATKKGGNLSRDLLIEESDFDQEEDRFNKLLDSYVGSDFALKGSDAEIAKDYPTAMKLYLEAADHGFEEANSYIGGFYEHHGASTPP